jgi:hypothetical protein
MPWNMGWALSCEWRSRRKRTFFSPHTKLRWDMGVMKTFEAGRSPFSTRWVQNWREASKASLMARALAISTVPSGFSGV